jgi:hypothetical protein
MVQDLSEPPPARLALTTRRHDRSVVTRRDVLLRWSVVGLLLAPVPPAVLLGLRENDLSTLALSAKASALATLLCFVRTGSRLAGAPSLRRVTA